LTAYRCSTASRDRAESIAGTASTVRRFLLVECSGPWGREALRDSRLPADVRAWLRTTSRRLRLRTLLIRRPGRRSDPGVTVFAASVQPGEAWVEQITLDSPEELTGLDLTALGDNRSVGFTPTAGPLFLVCTHGRHDACCAERGRPVAAALAEVEPEATWEVSHIGGDRFAGNLLVLPDGLYYGRLEPAEVVELAAAHRSGNLALDFLRGRTCYPFDVQAAEIHLRTELQAFGRDEFTWVDRSVDGALSEVTFDRRGDERWRVVIRKGTAPATTLTCAAQVLSQAPAFELVSVSPVSLRY
jgi:hypothetical protein